ncbi:MAG: hypothetical protein ACI8RZ_002125 [Myxococcota bacterium]|jgi:hypothetical protein
MRLILLSLLLASCKDKSDGNGGGTDEDAPYTTESTQTVTTGSDGTVTVEITAEKGESAFLITGVKSGSGLTSVEYIDDPDGETVLHWQDWYYEAESLTYAFFPASNTTVNWPVREVDGTLTEGTWSVVLGAYNNSYDYVSDEDIELTIHRKWDPDLSEGTVKVVLVYAEGLEGESDLTEGVDYALEEWADIWSQVGLSLEYRFANSDLSPTLSDPSYGSAQLEEASGLAGDDEIVVLIGEQLSGDLWTYGVSGNIPGGLSVSENGGVVISWLAAAGANGSFDEGELDIFAETMAHEVGHYMGLFHPVEDGWEYWDALEDTSDCDDGSECYRELGENLMFPFPVCDWDDNCDRQDQVSGDQGGVLNRYTGTL